MYDLAHSMLDVQVRYQPRFLTCTVAIARNVKGEAPGKNAGKKADDNNLNAHGNRIERKRDASMARQS